MCDQDHFEDDRQEYEARGLVTRRQFGVLVGAGIAMMLPQVANAVAVTESDVKVTTPDGTADCYFVHPASGTAPGVLLWPDIFGLRPAFRQMGKRLAESGYSVLVVNPFYRAKKAPTADARRRHADSRRDAARAGAQRNDAHDRRQGVHRVARSAAVGGEEPENRHAGLLHGRPDCVSHGGGGARSRRRGRLVPWRRTRDRHAEQSASAGPKTKAQFLIAIAANDDQRSPNEKNVLKDTFAKASLPAEIEVYKGARTAGARRIPASTTSRRPRRRGADCSRSYGKALA